MSIKSEILIVQRFYYNFREGFFSYLQMQIKFKLINSLKSRGRVIVHQDNLNKDYFYRVLHFFCGQNYVIFPFLIFSLIKLNPKIIITEGGQNTINNLQVYLYCKLFKKQFILWDLGKGYQDFGSSIIRNIYMFFYEFVAKNAKFVYTYNSLGKKYFIGINVPENKIVILNNTIDTISVNKTRRQNVFQIPPEIKSYNENLIYIIFVGALLPSKNLEILPGILKRLGFNYCLLMIGDGEKKYVNKLKESFIGTNCIFCGYKKINELTNYYQIASFSILPGLGGLTINQSMAFGVPVLCRSADGAEVDLVSDNITGYIYKNIDDLVEFVKSKTKADWSLMGRNAEKKLYKDFSIENQTSIFLKYL